MKDAHEDALDRLVRGPMKPRPDNLTPPARTPWGGRRIARWKAGLADVPSEASAAPVGESWEVSDDPAFPSVFPVAVAGRRREVTLADVLAAHADEVLGPTLAPALGGRLPILVKLIDAEDNLSVQVHPPDGYVGLAPGDSGKTEAWVVLERAPGAGLYLGLAPDVTREGLAEALARGDDVSRALCFVPVDPGDVFRVPPGTPHAIGRGCMVLEIQRFRPPSSGVTYRFWDWNRRYDAEGRPDPAGRSRPLHVADALAVTTFDGPRGEALVAALRCTPTVLRAGPVSQETRLLATDDGLRLHHLRVAPGAPLPLLLGGRFATLTCVLGRVALRSRGGRTATHLRAGESALLPAAVGELELVAEGLSELYVGFPD